MDDEFRFLKSTKFAGKVLEMPTPRRIQRALLLLSLLTARVGLAKADGTTAVVAPGVYTARALQAMDFENLARVADEFNTTAAPSPKSCAGPTALRALRPKSRRRQLPHAGRANAALPIDSFGTQAGAPPKNRPRSRLLREAIDTLATFGAFGRSRPSDLSREFDDLIEEASKQLADHIYGATLDVETAHRPRENQPAARKPARPPDFDQ